MRFNAVGVIGIGVQLTVLLVLTEWVGLHYLAATAWAVTGTVVHNFLLHERWTWADRPPDGWQARLGRLFRFICVTGTLALVANVGLTGFYTTTLPVHYSVANLMAIATCSLATFAVSDRCVFRRRRASRRLRRAVWAGTIGSLLVATSLVEGAELYPQTLRAWDVYIEQTEREAASRQAMRSRALVAEVQEADGEAWVRLRRGEVLVEPLETRQVDGGSIDVPDGQIHHWRGRVFIPDVSLTALLDLLTSPAHHETPQEDVLEARVLRRTGNRLWLFLKLTRRKLVTVHYNTEHALEYVRHDARRASSRSEATRIAEIERLGTPEEREKPVGDDRGFLWRLNSYWRYEAVDGGVVVECESVSLSRSVPAMVGWAVAPLVRDAATESMERTLEALRSRVGRHNQTTGVSPADLAPRALAGGRG